MNGIATYVLFYGQILALHIIVCDLGVRSTVLLLFMLTYSFNLMKKKKIGIM